MRVLNDDVVPYAGITPDDIERATEAEAGELARRDRLYRDDRAPVSLDERHRMARDTASIRIESADGAFEAVCEQAAPA